MVNNFFEVSELAELLTTKLNGPENANIVGYGLDEIYPRETYLFRIVGDTGEYKQPERIGNTVTNYINGEYRVISNDVEGTNEDTFNAVVQMRVEFLIPLKGPEKRNAKLINAVRLLCSNALKYTEETDSNGNSIVYTHFTNYSILNTGTRSQRDVVGDSMNLTILVTHTFVSLGVASSAIKLSVKHPVTGLYVSAATSKFGIARKTVSDSNVYAVSGSAIPETKQQPTSTVLTITADLLTRLLPLDYYINRLVYDGIVETIEICVTRPLISYDGNGELVLSEKEKEKENYYTVFIDAAGINGELGTISSTSVTFTTAAPSAISTTAEA